MPYYTSGCGRITLEISAQEATSASHQGRCDEDVTALLRAPHIAAQFAQIDPTLIREELREYGAWDQEELADEKQNQARLLWLACGEIVDEAFDRMHEQDAEALKEACK